MTYPQWRQGVQGIQIRRAGVFRESFVGEKNTVSNIFHASVQHQKLGILVAQHGYQTVSENGDRFLVLLQGRRYEGVGGSPDTRSWPSNDNSIRMHAYESSLIIPTQKSLSTPMLLSDRSPVNMGELLWRLACAQCLYSGLLAIL